MKQKIMNLLLPALLFTSDAMSAELCASLTSSEKKTEVSSLLKAYRHKRTEQKTYSSQKLTFTGVGKRDVYNPTKPFITKLNNQHVEVIAARVEARDSEVSEVMFFMRKDGTWSPAEGAPVFKMQDPFFTFINNELILGGVEIFARPEGGYGYKTIFMRGQSIDTLTPFAQGPNGMKDIRLVQLNDGQIGLFTRPQGMIPGTEINAGPGRIGFTVLRNLQELTVDTIVKAPLLEGQFEGTEWGGVNEAQVLANGKVGVLAHIALFDAERNRHYYSAVFTMDIASGKASPFEIILERSDLTRGLNGASKRNDLKDVVFSGGLALEGKTATIYVGAGDAELHAKRINKPDSFK